MTVESCLARLGSFCWKRPWAVMIVWAVAGLIAGSVMPHLPERLLSGSGEIEGSASHQVDEALRTDFHRNDAQSLILTFRSPTLDRDAAELSMLFARVADRVATLPQVVGTTPDRDIPDIRLRPKAGRGHFVLIELSTEDILATEQEVPNVRAAVAPVMRAALARHPDLEWAVTGRAALTHDINRFNAEDSARSELRALPITLAILVFAFGSLIAAMLPLLLALITRTVVLGIIFPLAAAVDVSNLVLSVVTMLAIALGIDYSLFLIHRYGGELAQLGDEPEGVRGDAAVAQAIRRAMAQSGTAVLYSAVTVAIGMGALLATPLMQTRSIGFGGVVAVLVALLAALTLVPAFLRLLRRGALEWPRSISERIDGRRSRRFWSGWADLVLRRPVLAIAASLALILSLAAPGLQTRFGFPEGEFLPAELEYSRGLRMLREMELTGLVSPVLILVDDTRNRPALTPDRAPLLARFVSRLEQDRRVRLVLGPVRADLGESQDQLAGSMADALGGALARGAFTSADRTRLLFQVIPSNDSTLADLRDLATEIPGMLDVDSLDARIGGQAQYYNDFDEAVARSYPLTIGLVLAMSAAALLLFFRAPLVSIKAILLNLLSVAAGYGVVVFVFQLGHGAGLFGLEAGTQMIPVTVPLIIFCILFGLSMDYEIFLLTRVRSIFIKTGDTNRSVREALADTGSVITSAALVMVAVFGAFAFARMVIVQMIGLGLAVAVLVDATVIRSVLGPALMRVGGRWNWWPAHRS